MAVDRRCMVASMLALPLNAAAGSLRNQLRAKVASTVVTRKSFGLHIVGVTGWDQADGQPTAVSNFGCGSLRIWDTGATWRRIQPRPGTFDWSTLDAEITIWSKSFDDILFCFGQAPDWATNQNVGKGSYNPFPPDSDEDVRKFIKALLERYPIISAVQVWNEPNFSRYFAGTVEQLAHISYVVASAVREARPEVRVIAASPQPYADSGDYFFRYLEALKRAGIDSMIDALAYHTYVQPKEPELMGPMIAALNSMAHRCGFRQPIWSTEFGWGTFRDIQTGQVVRDTVMQPDQAVAYLLRGYLIGLGHGLSRHYFYAVDKEFSALRLLGPDKRTVTSAGAALEHLTRLLEGGLIGCPVVRFDHIAQPFTSADGRSGLIAWTRDEGSARLIVPVGAMARDFLGQAPPIHSGQTVELGPIPIYLVEQAT